MDEVAKELKTRARIAAIYNKSREDFDSKEAWDDYLENIEDIIYNLVNQIDVQATEARVLDYERANRASIIANQARKANKAREALGVLPSQAAASAAAVAAVADAAQTFAPTVNASMGRQPVPTQQYQLDKHGSLVRSANTIRWPMGGKQEQEQSQAAGWSPEMPRLRALKEAFGSLLLS